jgi:glutamine---fructose-6-phosphate transaminase (isomerizing)
MSAMAREAAEAPEAVSRCLMRNAAAIADIAQRLRRRPPPVVVTCARGSSDHAAGFFKYLVEILLGIPCCSIGASVVSIYGARLKLKNAVCVTISQSGKSPDIVALQEAARDAGAFTIALVNMEDSPAATSADICLPLSAGSEVSVAATKSFVASLAAAAALVADWANEGDMRNAVRNMPEVLRRAAGIDWPEAINVASKADSLYVLGRGPALPIAQETALKLKETCAIHAEAFSTAEVMHGPLELLTESFPVLAYSPDDASRLSVSEALAKLRSIGARVLAVEPGGLSYARAGHTLLDPISMIQTAYRFVEAAAQKRGHNPDKPRLLSKVTETV